MVEYKFPINQGQSSSPPKCIILEKIAYCVSKNFFGDIKLQCNVTIMFIYLGISKYFPDVFFWHFGCRVRGKFIIRCEPKKLGLVLKLALVEKTITCVV